jgi:hypothetical protein
MLYRLLNFHAMNRVPELFYQTLFADYMLRGQSSGASGLYTFYTNTSFQGHSNELPAEKKTAESLNRKELHMGP